MAQSKKQKGSTAASKEDGSEPISEEMTGSKSPKSQTEDFQILSPNELKNYGLDLESELVISVRRK